MVFGMGNGMDTGAALSWRNGDAAPLLEVQNLTKIFPGCRANDDISLKVMPGEIHALLGENGAGKSTLVRMMYGVIRPDTGQILWQGEPVNMESPSVARGRGIGMVFQHLSLFEPMTVLENVALALPGKWQPQKLRSRIIEVARTYGLPLDPDRIVHTMSVGERQRIEIVRCLMQNPKLIVLDEPTSVLTPQEADELFATLRKLSSEGRAILYISHKLYEIQALCHHATVLREGKVVAECDPTLETPATLAEMMIGAKVIPTKRSGGKTIGAARLVVKDVSIMSSRAFGFDLHDINLEVRAGEILGIAGIAGNGQRELMRVLIGETPLEDTPYAITLDGQAIAHVGPIRRRIQGMAFVPEERHGHAAAVDLALTDNAFLTGFGPMKLVRGGLVRHRRNLRFTTRVVESYDVRTSGPKADAGSLSGGNLQKFVVGREIMQKPEVLIVSQPTWGVDPGAAKSIRQAIIDLATNGCAVMVISQDLDEIFEICDSIAVIAEGRLSVPVAVEDITIEEIGILMGGVHGANATEQAVAAGGAE